MAMGRQRDTRYDVAPQLYEDGMSIADCAEYFGITRQAMHKILSRRGVELRDNKRYGEDNHFYRGGHGNIDIKRKAQHMAHKAISSGVLKPSACEECNAKGTFSDGRNKIQAHHDDYSEPLKIRWLCQSCHHDWHKTNQARGGFEIPAADGHDVICGGYP